jgi:hypothetical protein
MKEITTLRGRLKSTGGIRYMSMRRYASGRELHQLHVTFKVLFRRNGMPIDELNEELKREGWLAPAEDLADIILYQSPQELRRGPYNFYTPDMELDRAFDEYNPQGPEDMIPLHHHV